MAKSIKIQVLNVAGFDKALVRIVAQTNRGAAFGNIEGDTAWKASNGIKLVSNRFPARDKDKTLPAAMTFYVRGSDMTKDNECFQVSLKKLPKLIDAIKEYNAWYTPQAINARVRAKREAEARAEAARQADLAFFARFAARPAAPQVDNCAYIVG